MDQRATNRTEKKERKRRRKTNFQPSARANVKKKNVVTLTRTDRQLQSPRLAQGPTIPAPTVQCRYGTVLQSSYIQVQQPARKSAQKAGILRNITCTLLYIAKKSVHNPSEPRYNTNPQISYFICLLRVPYRYRIMYLSARICMICMQGAQGWGLWLMHPSNPSIQRLSLFRRAR